MMTTGSPPQYALPDGNQLPAGVLHLCFDNLAPRDLCRASAVCRLWRDLNRDEAANAAWEQFYRQRWAAPANAMASPGCAGLRWQTAYGLKLQQAKCWRGKAKHDKLFGHAAGVRCLSLHPSSNTLFTGSVDRTVRMWDLHSGTQVAASRRPHGGTVRCLAADETLLLSGSSDHHIRAWRYTTDASDGDNGTGGGGGASSGASGESLLTQHAVLLPGGHTGPVTALALTQGPIFSGAWDYSVRVWDRRRLKCRAAVHVDDWVTSLTAAGDRLCVGCGGEVLLFSTGCGGGLRPAHAPLRHEGAAVTSVATSLDGRYVFFGTDGGAVVGADLRCTSQQGQRVLLQDPSGVAGLSWEDPCLGVSFKRGSIALLLDATAAMGSGAPGGAPAAAEAGRSSKLPKRSSVGVRWLSAGGGEPAACVALREQWLVAGFDCGAAASWDFSRAEEAERAAAALRQRKQERRRQRRRGAD